MVGTQITPQPLPAGRAQEGRCAGRDRLLARWLAQIDRLGLQAAALFLFDVVCPVRYLLTQACWVVEPWLGEAAAALAGLLEDDGALLSLQDRLRTAAEERWTS
ncbi:MAG: hypothetical protein ACUVX9_07205 [Anaerolineae bacterium]